MQKIENQASCGLKTAGIVIFKKCNLGVVDSAEEEKRTKNNNNSLELLSGTARYADLLNDGVQNSNAQMRSTKSEDESECEVHSSRLAGIEENSISSSTAVTTEKESPFVSLNSSGYWSDLQSLSVERDGGSAHGKKMAVGKWEHRSESQSLDQDVECGEHSLGSSAKREFPKDVTLSYRVVRQKTGVVDHELQEATRRRLCILESETKDVGILFNELSSRLVSIHAEKDLFVLTFKTVEEMWKFTTYLSLGFVHRCLENLLLDQRFWLNLTLVEDVKIEVEVNEEHLSLMYLDLLLQEGHFFTRVLCNIPKNEEQDLNVSKDDLIMVKDIGNDSKWEATVLATNEKGLIPVSAPQALLYPFYQWFLKTKAENFIDYEEYNEHQFPHSIGTGICVATMDHKEGEVDELCFNEGEKIQIIGFLLSNLQWFLGKSLSSGETGFVPVRHVRPDQFKTLETHLLFLSDEEKASFNMIKKSDEQHCTNLLSKLSQTDIDTVYRLDQIQAIEQLCSFYEKVLNDNLQCSVYYEHWLLLTRMLKDKEQEMKMLTVLSHLYFSFRTESSYRSSLSYTKQSLKNFIDLGMHSKEAEAWLMAGKIYYMMEKDELVDLYLQAAVQTAQRMKNMHFAMKINEAAGDIFYNGPREREKAVSFYWDGAVPLARMTKDFDVELRLFNKLTELTISLNHLERALDCAISAVRLSINTGDQLKERVAFYRLATVYYLSQQYEMAENFYLKALSLSPHSLMAAKEAKYYMKIYFRLGDITLHKLKDAHDAAGYLQMAFAAAFELGSKEDLFNICTKLANIYKNYIANEDLCSQFVEKAKAYATQKQIELMTKLT
ncbi:SH3 domain and tetratricopeptide repeat-containing protein 2-like isoform X2 [Narcine bancroftii]|uniref:SH3 domain and tetratricopeptide repeat-containing protein 2-like isoform X2 n=1 Tax=Narcine bancroftii TaxID=1343680 RepID=UPI003831B7C1